MKICEICGRETHRLCYEMSLFGGQPATPLMCERCYGAYRTRFLRTVPDDMRKSDYPDLMVSSMNRVTFIAWMLAKLKEYPDELCVLPKQDPEDGSWSCRFFVRKEAEA